MKIKINNAGNLEIEKIPGNFKIQECPFNFNANFCGNWCPHVKI